MNRTVNRHVALALIDHKADMEYWSLWMEYLIWVYNNTLNINIESTPAELFLGARGSIEINPLTSQIFNSKKEMAVGEQYAFLADKQKTYEQYHKKTNAEALQYNEFKEWFNDRPPFFKIGQLVSILLASRNNQESDKYRCHVGPFVVASQLSQTNYGVAGLDGIVVSFLAFKIIPYFTSLKEVYGRGNLAPTATGIAFDRMLFGRKDILINDKDPFDMKLFYDARRRASRNIEEEKEDSSSEDEE